MNIQQKQRFGIIGNSPLLDRAINIALQVSPTDISVFISGESGTGKENIPKLYIKIAIENIIITSLLTVGYSGRNHRQ